MKKILITFCILYLPVCFVHAQWKLTGNSGTTAGINYVGTTDSAALMFKVLKQKSGFLSFKPGSATSFGYQALKVDSLLNYNAAFGYQALFSDTKGQNNTAI